MKVAIVLFPGTNCELDTQYAFELLGCQTQIIWHKESEINADLIVLPGGFSYGDYLRTAAIAKFSPAMSAVVKHAQKGGYVLGICNGFQMLCELKLLAGAMRRNENLSFISKYHHLKVVSNANKFLSNFALPSSAPLKTHLLPSNLHPKIPPKPRENLISFSCELLF